MSEIESFLSPSAEKQMKNAVKLMTELGEAYEKAFKSSKKLDDQIGDTDKKEDDRDKKKKKRTELEKEEARILAATARTKAKLAKVESESNKALVEQQELLKQRNKELREEAKQAKGLTGAFAKLNRQRAEAARKLKDLVASEKASNAQIQRAQAEFTKLNDRVVKANRAARQFNDNVGNYPTRLRAATSALKGFIGAFGVVGGIALFARAVQDAFKRIREFDKSVTELSGILGVSRENLQDVEKEIIRVAGSSTKTSSEVADLAVALATLGQKGEDLKNLIKPTNDLAIALKATSEEAGQLLVGTLNAFQESSSQAVRYANVIAKVRTTTALDFQGIKDALGFVAPTAFAVGESIESIAARLGVLADNNIKAARAGRLLNSGFARLVGQGLTLDEALDQISQSTNKLQKASQLFGNESFSLALILADNREKVDELTTAYENSAGSLDELVNVQLESFDAKIKILDSSFEKFILTITKGDNATADFVKNSLEALALGFDALSESIDGVDNEFEDWKNLIREINPSLEDLGQQANMRADNISVLKSEIDELNKSTFSQWANQTEILKLESELADVERERAFILDLLKARIDSKNKSEEEAKEVVEELTEAELAAIEAIKKRRAEQVKDLDIIIALQDEEMKQVGELIDVENQLEQIEETRQRNQAQKLHDEVNARREAQVQKLDDEIAFNDEIDKLVADELATKQKLSDELEAVDDTRRSNQLQKEKDAAEMRIRIIGSSIQLISEIFNGFQQNRIQQLSDESTALELQRQTALEGVEGNKNREAQINAQFDRKQAAIKQRQWKAEQEGALFQIAVQTGVNAVQAFAGGPALIALAIGLGLAQAAFVKAQRPPKFAKGSKGLPTDTYGEVGDAGPELLFFPGGGVALANEPTKTVMPKGTVIKTNRETEQILAANQLKAGVESDRIAGNGFAMLSNAIAQDRQSVLKAIEDKNNTAIETILSGVFLSKRTNKGITTYLDKRLR